jgi:hypothetical protein
MDTEYGGDSSYSVSTTHHKIQDVIANPEHQQILFGTAESATRLNHLASVILKKVCLSVINTFYCDGPQTQQGEKMKEYKYGPNGESPKGAIHQYGHFWMTIVYVVWQTCGNPVYKGSNADRKYIKKSIVEPVIREIVEATPGLQTSWDEEGHLDYMKCVHNFVGIDKVINGNYAGTAYSSFADILAEKRCENLLTNVKVNFVKKVCELVEGRKVEFIEALGNLQASLGTSEFEAARDAVTNLGFATPADVAGRRAWNDWVEQAQRDVNLGEKLAKKALRTLNVAFFNRDTGESAEVDVFLHAIRDDLNTLRLPEQLTYQQLRRNNTDGSNNTTDYDDDIDLGIDGDEPADAAGGNTRLAPRTDILMRNPYLFFESYIRLAISFQNHGLELFRPIPMTTEWSQKHVSLNMSFLAPALFGYPRSYPELEIDYWNMLVANNDEQNNLSDEMHKKRNKARLEVEKRAKDDRTAVFKDVVKETVEESIDPDFGRGSIAMVMDSTNHSLPMALLST